MADEPNGGPKPATAAVEPKTGVRVVAQYIKDLSFENPNVLRLIDGPGDNPGLNLEVNVNAKRLRENLYESAIEIRGKAANKSGTIYEIELIYAGLFQLENMPAQALEPFLLVNCPALIFPFARRVIADTTQEGGFPPLLLDPVDFAGLYAQKKKQGAVSAITS